jgi:hypothetical protein
LLRRWTGAASSQHKDSPALVIHRLLRTGLLLILVSSLFAVLGFLQFIAVEGWWKFRPLDPEPTAADRYVSSAFMADPAPARYEVLFSYFLQGFVTHASPDLSRVHYPGLPSINGYDVSGIQGFARTAPLLGAWLYSGRPRVVLDPASGRPIDLVDRLRRGILAGTTPSAAGYWGRMSDDDPRIVDSADIARLLWLTRDHLWFTLNEEERARIAAWLSQVNEVKITYKNNWLLFPAVVNAFLESVRQRTTHGSDRAYMEFKRNYLQMGWFRDGPTGRVDFYNAWGISYDLFWIHLMRPDFDRAFLEIALLESGRLTSHLISPRGIPMMGRSICYRTGIPAAVIAASFVAPRSMPPGLARHALDATWNYFVQQGILRNGSLTMGYTGTDPRLVDAYTGPGSCHWGLRSLVLAFMAKPTEPFWTAKSCPLPVETADYRLDLPRLGWSVTGEHATGEIVIEIDRNPETVATVKGHSPARKLLETLLRRPMRPSNATLKYKLRRYSALQPFGNALSEAH